MLIPNPTASGISPDALLMRAIKSDKSVGRDDLWPVIPVTLFTNDKPKKQKTKKEEEEEARWFTK